MATYTITGVPRNSPVTRTVVTDSVQIGVPPNGTYPCGNFSYTFTATRSRTTNADIQEPLRICELLQQGGVAGPGDTSWGGTAIDFTIPSFTGTVTSAIITLAGIYDGTCVLVENKAALPYPYIAAPVSISASNDPFLLYASIPSAAAVNLSCTMSPSNLVVASDGSQIRAYGPFSGATTGNPYATSGSLEAALAGLSSGGTLTMNTLFSTGWAENISPFYTFGGYGHQVPLPNHCQLDDSVTLSACTLTFTTTGGGLPPPPPPPAGQYNARFLTARYENIIAAAFFSAVQDPAHTTTKSLVISTNTNLLTSKYTDNPPKGWNTYVYGAVDYRSELGLYFLPNGTLCLLYDVWDAADSVLVTNIITNQRFGAGPKENWSSPQPMITTQGTRINHAGRAQQSCWKLRIT